MERFEVCFVPKPEDPDSFLLKLRGLTREDVGDLDQAAMLAMLDQVEKSVVRAKNKVRRNPAFFLQFVEAPQFH